MVRPVNRTKIQQTIDMISYIFIKIVGFSKSIIYLYFRIHFSHTK